MLPSPVGVAGWSLRHKARCVTARPEATASCLRRSGYSILRDAAQVIRFSKSAPSGQSVPSWKTAATTSHAPLSLSEEAEGNRVLLMSKAWYGGFAASSVSLLPYLAVWLNSLGISDGYIGLAMALRPWLSAITMLAVPTIADVKYIHRGLVCACFVLSTGLRCSLLFLAINGFGNVAIIVTMIVAEMVAAPVQPIVDSLTVAACKKYNSTYGEQRMWGSVGWGLFSVPVGLLMERFGTESGFYAYGLLALPCIPVAMALRYPRRLRLAPLEPLESLMVPGMDVVAAEAPAGVELALESIEEDEEDKEESPVLSAAVIPPLSARRPSLPTPPPPPVGSSVDAWHAGGNGSSDSSGSDNDLTQPDTLEDLKVLMENPSTWLFLGQCFMIGAVITGLIGTYIFLYVKQMGAPSSFMGLILMVNCIAEIFFFRNQEWIMSFMSPQNLINLCMGAMVVRLMIYAYAPGTWAILIAEALQGVTFAAGWVAGCVKAKELAPEGMEATMQGLMTAMFLGIGAGAGALVGGQLLECTMSWKYTWLTSAGVVLAAWAAFAFVEKQIEGSPRKEVM